MWFFARRPPERPKGRPSRPGRAFADPETDARDPPPPSPGYPARRAPPRGGRPTLRVDADVPSANVFLDRKFLGTTPVETRDLAPGAHRLNVSAEGYDMYAETIELPSSPQEVMVRFKEVRLDERVDVVHKHGMGSCRGRLLATTAGLRYEADKAGDSFEVPFETLEPLEVDYLNRNLRVKQTAGRPGTSPPTAPTGSSASSRPSRRRGSGCEPCHPERRFGRRGIRQRTDPSATRADGGRSGDLPRELAVLDAVGLVGLGAEAPLRSAS